MRAIDWYDFGTYFINNEFQTIYAATADDFKNLVTFEQFAKLCAEYNEGVDHYEIAYEAQLDSLTQLVLLDDRKKKAVVVAFDENRIIQTLYLKPYVTYPETDGTYTKNSYRLPIHDEWFVFWGGANEFINYHYAYEQQRYAYDLVIINEGQSFKDSPISNENYYAFGKDVVAPYAGKVVSVVDGLKDNIPGEMDEQNPAGNYIVIAHPNEEYSMIAHFKKDSIIVKPGDSVKEGQLLGQCGNSGNSSEAHIHFQVMDNADLHEAKSIRIQFRDGHEPIQGEIVKPALLMDSSDEAFHKIENSLSVGEILLTIRRIIGQIFQ
ncbi:M23 family metallopeptidase [Solibacillus silvestris]|uniref:M23 family metallopeptidase n=1 Tax=Solibacillus silvestris TaxID=76853 RepID=UPI003F7FF383